MKRLLFSLAFLAVVVGGAFFGLQFLLSPDFISAQLQQAVKTSTGRALTLGSAPRLSFWPKLSVELEDAVLSNPPDMFKGSLVQMQSMRISVDALELMSRKLTIEELTLVNPRVSLVVDGEGRANWSFDDPQASPAPAPSEASGIGNPLEQITVAPIKIENGDVRFVDERSGSAFAASNVNMIINLPDPDAPLDVQGSLVWKNQPVSLKLFVKAPQALASSGSPVDAVISSDLLNASYNGRLVLKNGLDLAGQVDMKTRSVRKLADWAGAPLTPGRGLGPFYAKSAISVTGEKVALNDGRFGLDSMNAQGNLAVALGGDRPTVTGSLGVDKVDVNAYLEPAVETAQGGLDQDWSDEPIDFSGLNAVNARLALAAGQIIYRDVVIGNTRLDVALVEGLLDAKLTEMAFYKGQANGQIRLSGAGSRPQFSGALAANGLDGYRLLRDFAQFKRIAGTTALNVNVTATGKSQRELVSTLNGKAGFKFENGALRGINIPRMVRSVQTNILGGWQSAPEEKTDFSLLEANFDIRDGVAVNKEMKLIGPLMRVNGAGQADMLRRHIDYRVEPKVVASLQGQGSASDLQGLKVPVIVRGPWTNPKIYPDIKGILENPQAAYDALSNLIGEGQGIDLKAGQKNLEKKAIGQAEKLIDDTVKDQAKKVLGEQAGEVVGENAKTLLKDEGKSLLKGLFGQPKP